jgi:hypothetical protein
VAKGKSTRRAAQTLTLLPSVGKPDLDRAAKLLAPVIVSIWQNLQGKIPESKER